METIGTGVAVLGPMWKSVKQAGVFEDAVKDVAITGELSPVQEMALGKSLRGVALKYNQLHADVTAGVGVLVAEGMDAEKAGQQAGILAKTATAIPSGFSLPPWALPDF